TDGDTDFENDPTVTLTPASSSLATVKTSVLDITGGVDATIADVGDVFTYTYTVENTGNTTLTGVSVSETIFSGSGGAPTPVFDMNDGPSAAGTLIPGETATFEATYAITQADIDAGGLENSATGTGTPPADPDGTINPALTDVSDAGDDTLNEPGLDGTDDGDTDFENDPTVSLIPASPSIATVKSGVLDITGGLDATVVDAGDTIEYTYTVENTGNTTLTGVNVSETLFSGSGGAPTPGFDMNSGPSAAGTLIPGETATFEATYTLTQADIDAGGIENSATGTGTPPADPDGTINPAITDVSDAGDDTLNEPGLDGTTDGDTDFENDPTVVLTPASSSLATVKTSVLDITGGADATIADVGDTIAYTYTVENTGNTTLTGVSVSETIFSGSGGAPTPLFDMNDGPSAAGTLIPGETATFEATYVLTQADINAGGIENSATGTGTPPADPDGT
ncbi:DUF7507 domain-containing protein, partial [Aquimarina pacifica]|uniref:DUF7507 domain-containing protein n=1 Tax=Aquimarina pacifica TaxID=1296415 RepID=UPI000552458B